ncbi:Pyruvate kinase [Phytophthora cactorum]|uniref:Pyruvate kinase n=4 Tax=Phytophthora TaxID=4783 RepID=A0A8T0Y5G9_9STRA|nr:Pyruvate kinase [Phytophthora cactorum]KAG2904028.1 Pyruvate kinase [Phytophthora cactorum]KAG2916793.1 Pyruvate kinase [Phytophthora cactorum]KAG2930911.1 Pyruvate kinase [Phytophthora cactorum]KAG2982168.1 Pyruvate kinase [Phytophthora cactorum]
MGGLVFAFLRPHAGRHSAFGVNAWQFNYSDGHGEHGQQSTPPTALPGRKKAHVHGIELVPAFGAGYLEQQQGNVNGYSRASRLTVAFVSSALTNRDHGRSYYDLRLQLFTISNSSAKPETTTRDETLRAMSGALGLSQQGVELESIMRSVEGVERKTRIFCTLGPSCWTEEGLGELIDTGMNVARFNFSHGDHTSHAETLNRLRAALASRPHKNIAIMLDTKGPEIRTGFLANKDKVTIKKGSTLELTTDYEFLGDETKIACSYPELPQSVKVGGSILVADGSLVLTVTDIKEDGVVTRANNTATLGERKNMNLPGCKVMLPTLTEKDEDDLVNFGLVHGVDYIAASFVRTGQDIDNIRQVLGPRGRAIKIIAKIENLEGLENFDEILAKTDGIMVARGDLGMEIPPEKVFLAQKMMIRKANIAGKPVVTATQMLESMIKAPRPTRAECTDVANAVLDGTDAVMLSGETANGDYPTEAVQMMSKICVQAEGAIHYNELYQALHNSVLDTYGQMDTQEAITSSAVKTAIDINAKMIVVLTESGNTARLVSKFRPSMPVLVLTALGGTARQAEGFNKGVTARCMGSMIGTDSILFRATDLGKQFGWVKPGDNVVALHGMVEARSGSTNMLKVLTVE